MILQRRDLCAGEVRFGSEKPRQGTPANNPSQTEATDQRKLRILIVEDELFVAMHLEAVLEEAGYEVAGIVSTGESAVKEFHLYCPDLILMDINLGKGMDGITAAQHIWTAGHVQVVFVTAYSDPATRTRIQTALPGSRVLSKPVTPLDLKTAVGAVTQRRH